MQTQTMVSPAELLQDTPKHSSRAERHAAEHLREDYRELLLEANRIHEKLRTSQNNFNYLSGIKEIDACIYQIRTDQCRYESTLTRLQELQTRMQNLMEH